MRPRYWWALFLILFWTAAILLATWGLTEFNHPRQVYRPGDVILVPPPGYVPPKPDYRLWLPNGAIWAIGLTWAATALFSGLRELWRVLKLAVWARRQEAVYDLGAAQDADRDVGGTGSAFGGGKLGENRALNTRSSEQQVRSD